MKRLVAFAALAATLMSSAPAMAQSGYERGYSGSDRGYNGGWNSNEFWRGAPSGVWDRIRYLDQRIDRGVRDGSLTRREADRARTQLRRVRQDASYMRRNGMDPSESARIQARLDEVSRNLRWARRNDNVRDASYYDRYRTDYDASRYYRDGNYQERYLSANDEVYRGSDGRYYCKRNDGTTGLIIGGGAGALIGGAVSNGIGGALIGGALGALLGRQVDRNSDDIRCR